MKPFLRLFFFCIILMHPGSASTMAHDGTVYIVGTVKAKPASYRLIRKILSFV